MLLTQTSYLILRDYIAQSVRRTFRSETEHGNLVSLVPRPHPRGEEKGSGYNTTSRPTLEAGRNQIP